jgi:hypothetical protein
MVPGQERWMTDLLKTQDEGSRKAKSNASQTPVFMAQLMGLQITALSPLEM